MFKIIKGKVFWNRFLLNFLLYLPLFIIIQLFSSDNRLSSVRSLVYIFFMSGLLSAVTSFRQAREYMENSEPDDSLPKQKGVGYFMRFFAFAFIFILVLLGIFLLIAFPILYFLDEPISFEDWDKWLLMIAVIAAYACFSDWFFNKFKVKRKAL